MRARVFLHGAHLLQPVHLPHGHLKLKPEHLLFHFAQLLLQLRVRPDPELLRLHMLYSAVRPAQTNLVLMGSLWAARRMACSRSGRGHAFHFKQNLARADHRHPLLRSALAFSHTGFGRLLGDRLVGEQPDPHFAAALDGTRHGDAGGFNLPVGDPAALHGLQTEIAERDASSRARLCRPCARAAASGT